MHVEEVVHFSEYFFVQLVCIQPSTCCFHTSSGVFSSEETKPIAQQEEYIDYIQQQCDKECVFSCPSILSTSLYSFRHTCMFDEPF